MPTITAGASAIVTVPLGYVMDISSTNARVTLGAGPQQGNIYPISGDEQIGPFSLAQVAEITAYVETTYTLRDPAAVVTPGGSSDGSTTFEDVTTTTYTATAADFASDGTAKTKRFTNAAGCLVTPPAGLALTAGMVMKWLQAEGAGQITFQGDGTSTVDSAGGDLVSAGELSSGYVEHQGGDDFLLVGQIGTPRIVQNSKSAAYELVLSDAGKHLLHPSADTTARTFTIPANSAVAFPVGTVVTFINQASAGVLTIAITTDTMRLAGAGTTGSRTLAANGIATAIKVTATEWIISGTGLT